LQKYIVVKISEIECKALENLFRMSSKYLKIYQTDKSQNKEKAFESQNDIEDRGVSESP